MEQLQVKTYLTGELLKRFEEIKVECGLKSDSETLRHCIARFPMNGEGGE
jgi:hypothetical protein